MGSIFKGIERYLCAGFMKKAIAYTQIILQILLGTLPLYSMSFSTQANSDITKKTVLFKQLHTLTPTDTLESVAASYGLSVDELWALNINLYNNRSAFDAVKYGAVVYVPNQEEEQRATQQASLVASHLSQVGNSLSSENRVDAFSRLAKGMLLSSTAKTVEEWLGHIGQAQVKLQTDDKNDFSGSEIDLFIPLYDQPDKLAFSQFGFRRIDQRNIMNIGLGQRHYVSDWMFGYNIFFDQQISGNAHRRVGFGGELARDYLKLSANSYHRLGGWKNSARLEDYDERAANGYDIRTEAYLPHYPQLGGKLMYEQYFGDEVALFGINERQKNPSALTAGVSYTPIPLVSLGLDHTIGNGGKKKTGVNVAVNYEINTPWPQQIDPAAVQATRTLAGSRMDLVDRNNNIVLEYRKQQVVTLNLPEKVSGKEKQVVPINYTFNARHGLDRIEWDAADVIKAGGQVSNVGNLAYHVAMPPYIDGAANAYVLSGRAIDKKGNYSTSSSTNIYVTGVNINRINSTISLNPATLPANGTSRSIIQLKLNTDAGQAVSGASGQMTFAIRDSSGRVFKARTLLQPLVIDDVQEVQSGVYEASITSGFLTGRFEITPTVRGVQLNPIILTQSADKTTATITDSSAVTISTPSITTNATDKTKLEVLVTDALGHPVPGVEVKWVSDLKSSSLEHATSITNEHGIAENNFSSTVTGTANITVQVGTEAPVQAGAIEIKADNSTMTVKANDFTVAATPVVADGTSKAVYKLKVTDKQGNVVPGAAVEWSSNIGSFVQGNTTTITDANGIASIEFVSTKAETAKVTATVGGKPYNAGEVVFVADRQSGKITLLPVSKNTAAANGTDSITLNAKILDANGNPIKNEEIEWDAASHKVTFSPTTGKTQTNDLGETQITLTSTDVGDITLNAQVVKNNLLVNQASEKLSFTADTTTAKISDWSVPSVKTFIADGQAQVTYKVVVKDKNGHVVANSPVLWETNLGEFVPAQPTTTMTSTNSQGEATVVLASIKAGFATVKASVNGNKNTSPTQVEFTANRSTAKITLAPMTQRDFVANDKDKVTYSVTVVDANNNPVKAEAISWKAENGHPVKIEPASSQTDEQGKATVNIGSVKAGKTQIRATLGNAATAIADAITFEADRKTAVIKTVEVKGDNKPAPDGSSSVSYVTTVVDANGNPVGGMTLSWDSNINKIASQITTTDINGQSSQTITGTQVGKVEVSVALTEGDNAKIKKENIGEAEFVAITPVASNAELLLQPNVIISDGKQTATLRFTLRDANHNPVSGLASKINITQSVADHVNVGTISETTAKGVYQASISGTKEGSVDLTASVQGMTGSKVQRLTLQADNKTATLKSVTSDIKKAAADGTASITYTATVVDAQGNASLADVSVGWTTSIGNIAVMTKTDKDGKATATLTSKQAGSTIVTAIVSASNKMDAAPVAFTAGGIAIAQSTASVSAIDLVADGVTTTKLTVKVNDANGNPLTGQSGKIKVTAANFPGLKLPTAFTEVSTGVYSATITGTKAGDGEIVTQLDGTELAKQKLKVIADVRSAKIAAVNPLQAGSVAVGDKVTYQATLKDANDNLLGAGIPVHWSVNRDTLMSGKLISLTNSAGVAEVEISRDLAGDALVTAAVGNNSLQATAVKFISGGVDISKSSMQLLQGNITADNLDIATIQVDIRDSKGNPLPNLASQITTSPKEGEHGLKIETIANPSGDGYLVKMKGTKAGNHTVTVSVAGKPLSAKVDMVLKGDATTAKIEWVKSSSITFKADNVDTVTYTAKVVDANNNLLENITVSWRLAQGGGQYRSQSYTGKTGVAETKLRASILGTYKMEAQVRQQVKAAADVNSTAGDIDPAQSDFVGDVTSIDASGSTKAKLTATLKDKFGNLLVGQIVKLTDSNNLKGIKFTADPMKDNGDGTYSTEVSATAKGNTQIIASINSVNLTQQPQLLVGNIIPQLSFDNKNVARVFTRALQPKQLLKGLPKGVTVHWSSGNSDVAKVNPTTGEIELLKAGIVEISAMTLADSTYAVGIASYQLEVERADPKLAFAKRVSSTTWGQAVTKEQPNVGNSDWVSSQPQLKWSSSALDVAKVDSSGSITLLKAGDTLIKATTEQTDQFKASEAEYVLNINKANLVLNFSQSLKQYSVDSQPSNVQSLNLPSDLPTRAVRWSSSNPSVMNIDSYGRINRVSAGETDIKIEIDKNDFYLENSAKYLAEVYKKPSISISSTNIVSKGISSSNSSEWKPAFKGDQMVVNWRVSGSGKFEGPQKVVVQFIEENSGNKLFEKESTSNLASGSTTIEDIRVKNLVGKRGRFVVKTEGISGLSSQEKTKVIDVKRLYPDEIWNKVRFRSGYSIYHKGKSVGDCRLSKLLWNAEHHVNMNWDVGIDLGNNELIEGMEVKLRIDKVKSTYISPRVIAIRNILKTFNEKSEPGSSGVPETLHTDCFLSHNDLVELVLDVDYLGKTTMYNAGEVYWEGEGRYKESFVEAKVERK
ncbi:TPA: Ig-like domain-containing protein [Yersinia enterocolitica]